MKILHINLCYPTGSTGKLVKSLHTYALDLDCESYVLFGRLQDDHMPLTYKFCKEWESYLHSAVLKLGLSLDYAGVPLATNRAVSFVKDFNPDIVHIHCLNGSCINLFKLFGFLAKNQIKTVITHHAEFYYTANCPHAYDCLQFTETPGCTHCENPSFSKTNKASTARESWKQMQLALDGFTQDDLYNVGVSPWVDSRGRMSSLLGKRHFTTILNGVNTSIFHRCSNRTAFTHYGCDINKKIVLHVAAHFTFNPNDNKGGVFIQKLAELNPEIEFVVIASRVGQLDYASLPTNMHVIGRAKDQNQLAQFYSSADVTIITSKRETFSMICAESLSCGTPVVGFKAGGPESIGLKDYAQFEDYGDLSALNETMHSMLSCDFDRYEIEKSAHKTYSDKRMCAEYFELYNKILQK